MNRLCILMLGMAGQSVLAGPESGPDIEELFSLSLDDLRQVRLVSAATGYAIALGRAPASATVITAAEWRQTNARTVFDVLAMVPGLSVSTSFGGLSERSVTIRGLATAYDTEVVWLLDGRSLKELPNNSVSWGWDFPLASLKQIEVVRGPGSAVFGADAFAGVINLVTVPAGEQRAAIALHHGSFDSSEFGVTTGGKTDEWRWSISLEWMRGDTDTARRVDADLQSLIDSLLLTQATLAPGLLDKRYEIENLLTNFAYGNWQMQFWHWRNRDNGTGAGAAQALDPIGFTDTQMQRLQLARTWELAGGSTLNLQTQIQWGENTDYYRLFPPGAVLPIGADGNITFNPPEIVNFTLFTDGYIGAPESETRRRLIEVDWIRPFESGHVLRVGLGSEWHEFWASERKNFGPGVLDGSETVVSGALTDVTGTPGIYAEDADRRLRYLLMQSEWSLSDQLTAVLGGRIDDYSDFGQTRNPRVALMWRPSAQWLLRVGYGSAFRAPSFTEQNFKNNPSALGNPQLLPETLTSSELAFQWTPTAQMQWDLTVFRFHADDLIAYAPTGGTVGLLAQNIGEKDGYGGELSLFWKPALDWRFIASYSQTDVEDGDGQDVPYVPAELWKAAVEWRLSEKWLSYLGYRRVADRERTVGDLRAPIADYQNLDFKLGWRDALPGLELELSISNLEDAEQRDPSDGSLPNDLPRSGRAVWFGATYQF